MIQCNSGPTWGDPLHNRERTGTGKPEKGDTSELQRAEQENEKQRKDTAAKELDFLGTGRDRKNMLHQSAQQIRGKESVCQNIIIEN